jgi:hypothetical protein
MEALTAAAWLSANVVPLVSSSVHMLTGTAVVDRLKGADVAMAVGTERLS